mgnify:FL=1
MSFNIIVCMMQVLQYLKNEVEIYCRTSAIVDKLLMAQTLEEATEVLENTKTDVHNLYLKRRERYKLYCLLKGKKSDYHVFSYGEENFFTKKKIIIKKK